ncbi:hypothetical protein A9K97_gp265 [Tokyovirus A1]|nr:hypothetical protein A9K97_gp265 [Tokyovirus A1]BAU80086.1 hypothetical protein [Tokyovirus A1]
MPFWAVLSVCDLHIRIAPSIHKKEFCSFSSKNKRNISLFESKTR